MSFRPTNPILGSSYLQHVRSRHLTHLRMADLHIRCRHSPSIYAIFESIRASDGCDTVGTTFAGLTTSFPPGVLSSVGRDSSISSFNFGDLPCPPADKGWDPSKGQYRPQLAAPDFLFKLDPAFAACTTGYSQGIDPCYTLQPAPTGSGPGPVGCKHGDCKPKKRAVGRPDLLPWTAQKTAEPTS